MKAPSEDDRFVAVSAYLSDEHFGYDNWHCAQFGVKARPAVLILCADKQEQRDALDFLEARAATFAAEGSQE